MQLRMAVGMIGALAALSGPPAQANASEAVGNSAFREPWIDGTRGAEPEIQVQRYDDATYVLRQSVKTNVEAPFIYLFFGMRKVLQIDTGAGGLKIRPTIEQVIAAWLAKEGLTSIQLVVAHSHSHNDHITGDAEFIGRPNTTVVGHSPEQVAAFFKIDSWPDQIVAFDLGGRLLDIIPSPGHEPAEISVFDERTHILLTGDELYPGRLYVPANEFQTDRRSIDRVVDFTRTRKVSWVLGCHIEMTQIPGRDYPFHAASHPLEHPLELPYSSLLELQSSLHKMGDLPQLDIHKNFIFYPLP